MQVINSRLELPKKFRMLEVPGTNPQARFKNAQAMAAERNHVEAFYIERKDYKASCAYLFLVIEQ